ncbi:MAG: adenylate/guanylate cyclase domain-containing protein [Elusimicrobia bacterium]|nr:adenylate/guanylate cyclase domain-containing protein [Elusimicrobiota bacterium]
MAKALRGLLPLAVLLAGVGVLVLAARPAEVLHGVELKTLDWRFRHLSTASRHDPRVVLVAIDQASIDHFESEGMYWPWPRGIYEALLRFMKKGGAKAVVFDVLFTNPSTTADDDAVFGKALKEYGSAVMAMETGPDADPRRGVAPAERFALKSGPAISARARRSVRLPVPALLAGVKAVGDVKADSDFDGIFRKVPLAFEMGGRRYPTLHAATAMLATGKTLDELNPKLTDGRLLIRFHGKSLTGNPAIKTYDIYSMGDVLLSWQAIEDKRKPTLDPSLFKDKIVFIAMTASGLLDNHPSPIAAVFPGTEIVAAATDNLMNGDGLTRAPFVAVLALVLAALLLAGLASRLSSHAVAALGVVLASSAALAGISCYVFTSGVWLDMVGPQLSLWLGFAAASAYGYAVEGKQKRYIQGAFSQYLSPEIVKQIADSPEMLVLGGERRDVTFYFSDIQGFTTFSEQLPPEKLTQLMNRYLGEMTDTILKSGGTLDKYIGDAIMAFWGAPVDCPGHELVACKAALANQKRLASLRDDFARQGYPPVRNRIGLNSGPASIGNMGSAARLSYTAIGDNVNLASRLEGANKAYGTYILISESTRLGAGDAIEVRELDFVKVKGKNTAIRVYELLGLKGEPSAAVIQKARLFESGLPLFRGRRFEEAIGVFKSVMSKHGEDHACENYIERCEHYLKEPPPADWDGSHALTEK